MKKIIISIAALVLIIGVGVGMYVFVQDQKIKKELATVEEAQVVEDESSFEDSAFASEVKLNRVDGVWSTEQNGNFSIDTDSLVFEFTGYKPGGLHTGTFNNINSIIRLNEEGQPVSARLVLDVASVKTDTAAVDTHLQTDDFFSSAQYPEIVVEIKKIELNGNSASAITDITMKGVTQTVSIPMALVEVGNATTFDIDARIKISDFNIAYGPVQDEVRIVLKGTVAQK